MSELRDNMPDPKFPLQSPVKEICAGCGKPIEMGQPSYYHKDPGADIGKSYHSGCGDPFGIKAAVAGERERCGKIADDYAARCDRGSAVSSMAEDSWGAVAARAIAKTIRGQL